MAVIAFHGAMRPNRGVLGSDGRCMLNLHHIVERRCGSRLIAGFWADVWEQQGHPHIRSEFAQRAAEALRAEGFTVRVRPVLL